MTRFRISTLLFLIASFAVGWWFRGFTFDSSTERNAQRSHNAKQVDYVLASSVWINAMIEVSRGDPEEREIRFRNHLIKQLYDLARHEPFHTGNADDVFLMHGSNSLRHLGAPTFDELQEMVRKSRLVDSVKRPFDDETHQDYDRVRDFVTRCLSYDPVTVGGD